MLRQFQIIGVCLTALLIKAGCADSPPGGQEQAAKIRPTAVAGAFYPKDPKKLAETLDALLAAAKPPAPDKDQILKALICPHAGYIYSGPTAACGYKLLQGRSFETVIVLAPSHFADFKGASIPDVNAYETPLGRIPLSDKVETLLKSWPFVRNPPCRVGRPPWSRGQSPRKDSPHAWEHSLEVQLPFLQRVLGKFKLVPIVFGKVDPEAVARGLEKILDDNTLLIASSDLSHYHSYKTANRKDRTCIETICDLDLEKMQDREACGKLPILTLMHLAKKNGWKPKLLDYRNSGDTAGDKARVVGYPAIAFYQSRKIKGTGAFISPKYRPKERRFLLNLARKTLEAVVASNKPPKIDPASVPKKLKRPKGCFVTLEKHGRLRGCIGHIFPHKPLYRAVSACARSAALEDPRFPRVTPDELDDLRISISVLTVPKPLSFSSPDELLRKLRPHRDGVVLNYRGRKATYLPSVWKQLPQKETFLSHLSRKAGLAPNAWRREGLKILTYQVEAFHEQ